MPSKPALVRLPNGGEYDPSNFNEGPAAAEKFAGTARHAINVPRAVVVEKQAKMAQQAAKARTRQARKAS